MVRSASSRVSNHELQGRNSSPPFETPRRGAAPQDEAGVWSGLLLTRFVLSAPQFVFATAFGGAAVVTNSVASSMATPSGVGTVMR